MDCRSIALPFHDKAGDPGDHSQRRARRYHRPARGIDRAQLEAVASIPDKVPDAIAKMKEEGERPAEQQEEPEPRFEKTLHDRIRLWPRRRRDQPEISSSEPTLKAMPVTRWLIESTEVSCGL